MAINCPATHCNKLVTGCLVPLRQGGGTYATIDPCRKIRPQNDRADLRCVGRGEGL